MTSTKDVGKYSCKTGYKDETQTDQAAGQTAGQTAGKTAGQTAGQWSFRTLDQRSIEQLENNAAIEENVSLAFSCPMRL